MLFVYFNFATKNKEEPRNYETEVDSEVKWNQLIK